MHTRACSVLVCASGNPHLILYESSDAVHYPGLQYLLEKRTRQSTRTTSMYLLSLPNVWLDVRSADLPEWLDAL
ncbi:hypothetical protein V5799_027947 [Amblyomma americanum]|uniref:Uncharacterized protein n=1 Tax=Amblyomma americanum TaxID=6943 RepID=A0AAQ4DE98_AMBAM